MFALHKPGVIYYNHQNLISWLATLCHQRAEKSTNPKWSKGTEQWTWNKEIHFLLSRKCLLQNAVQTNPRALKVPQICSQLRFHRCFQNCYWYWSLHSHCHNMRHTRTYIPHHSQDYVWLVYRLIKAILRLRYLTHLSLQVSNNLGDTFSGPFTDSSLWDRFHHTMNLLGLFVASGRYVRLQVILTHQFLISS